jgi:hypothetical protein
MSTGLHKDLANAEIHTVVAWVYANATARLAATGFVSSDLYKLAYQLDTGTLWMLQDDSPITWSELASGGSQQLNKVEVPIKKSTSGTLAVGQAVYSVSWDYTNDLALCELARANSPTTLPCVGIVSVQATEAVEGKALLLGVLHDVDTSSLTAGAPTYLSAATAGLVTTTPPSGPYVVQALGVCLSNHATSGHLGVNILSYRAIQYSTPPASLGTAACGTSNQESASDHVHAHGDLAGGSLHSEAGVAAGFMSSADKTKLDGLDAPKSMLLWGSGSIAATTTTRYLHPGYEEAAAPTYVIQFRIPMAGTLKNLYVRHTAGAGNGLNVVYTVRKNGVATTLVVTLASTANDGNDLTHTVAVAQGDLLDIEVTKAASISATPTDIIATLEVV